MKGSNKTFHSPIKVLVIATEDYFGAGKAAFRIYETLKQNSVETYFLVKNKISTGDNNILKYDELVDQNQSLVTLIANKLRQKFTAKIDTDPDYYFFGTDDQSLKPNIKRLVRKLPIVPDVIIITWVSKFLSAKHLFQLHTYTKARLIAYPMDMSLFTGGCHYAWECEGYKKDCNNCPAILETSKKKFALKILNQKANYYKKSIIKPIAASDLLLRQLTQSTLFKSDKNIAKVLIPINEEIFNPKNRDIAKQSLNFSNHKKIIFFGSSFTNEKRKGITKFVNALKQLKETIVKSGKSDEKILIVIAGSKPESSGIFNAIPFETHFMGYINDDKKLSMIYQASDVFVCTSIQDSGPMMINEAIMCGTPVVSFDVGVARDLIVDGISGFNVPVGDEKMLSQGIYDVLYSSNPPDFYMNISEIGLLKTSYKSFPLSLFLN